MIRRAFEIQVAGGGFSIVEVLSTCPVGWGMTPVESMAHLAHDVVETYPLGVLVDRFAPADGAARPRAEDLSHGARAILCGFGGQGLLFAGKVLAQAALVEDREVSWMPSYGPEMRGGTASCTVVIADHPIGSPIVDVADSVIALNPPSMAKYEPVLGAGGLLVVNASLIEAGPTPGRHRGRPGALHGARPGGRRRPATSASSPSAALVARRPIVDPASIAQALAEVVGRDRPELVEANLAAFTAGFERAGAVLAR